MNFEGSMDNAKQYNEYAYSITYVWENYENKFHVHNETYFAEMHNKRAYVNRIQQE